MSEPGRAAISDPDLEKYPGLRVLRDVAGYLEATGIGSDELFQGIIGALGRGISARESRIWVRTPDGAAFRAFVGGGEADPDDAEAARVPRLVAEGEGSETVGDRVHVRVPL